MDLLHSALWALQLSSPPAALAVLPQASLSLPGYVPLNRVVSAVARGRKASQQGDFSTVPTCYTMTPILLRGATIAWSSDLGMSPSVGMALFGKSGCLRIVCGRLTVMSTEWFASERNHAVAATPPCVIIARPFRKCVWMVKL